MKIQLLTCTDCGHEQHSAGDECENGVQHGTSHWHRCLCLNQPGARQSCPPQMTCQGGQLGYGDIWNLRQGGSLQGADGKTITPDVLTADLQEPRASHSRWRVEVYDPVAEQWAPGSSLPSLEAARQRLAQAERVAPKWRDDETPVQRRIVRETTTYAVEADR